MCSSSASRARRAPQSRRRGATSQLRARPAAHGGVGARCWARHTATAAAGGRSRTAAQRAADRSTTAPWHDVSLRPHPPSLYSTLLGAAARCAAAAWGCWHERRGEHGNRDACQPYAHERRAAPQREGGAAMLLRVVVQRARPEGQRCRPQRCSGPSIRRAPRHPGGLSLSCTDRHHSLRPKRASELVLLLQPASAVSQDRQLQQRVSQRGRGMLRWPSVDKSKAPLRQVGLCGCAARIGMESTAIGQAAHDWRSQRSTSYARFLRAWPCTTASQREAEQRAGCNAEDAGSRTLVLAAARLVRVRASALPIPRRARRRLLCSSSARGRAQRSAAPRTGAYDRLLRSKSSVA
jgi:hypothetical protein